MTHLIKQLESDLKNLSATNYISCLNDNTLSDSDKIAMIAEDLIELGKYYLNSIGEEEDED